MVGDISHDREKLVQSSDIIIGTTGSDSLRGMYIERLQGKKTFISTSSSNIEFAYLFNLSGRFANTFEDVSLSISPQCKAVILNGGYPINFDRTQEWEALADIQLTRALLYAGVFEALDETVVSSGVRRVRRLKSSLEKAIAGRWLAMRPPAAKSQ